MKVSQLKKLANEAIGHHIKNVTGKVPVILVTPSVEKAKQIVADSFSDEKFYFIAIRTCGGIREMKCHEIICDMANRLAPRSDMDIVPVSGIKDAISEAARSYGKYSTGHRTCKYSEITNDLVAKIIGERHARDDGVLVPAASHYGRISKPLYFGKNFAIGLLPSPVEYELYYIIEAILSLCTQTKWALDKVSGLHPDDFHDVLAMATNRIEMLIAIDSSQNMMRKIMGERINSLTTSANRLAEQLAEKYELVRDAMIAASDFDEDSTKKSEENGLLLENIMGKYPFSHADVSFHEHYGGASSVNVYLDDIFVYNMENGEWYDMGRMDICIGIDHNAQIHEVKLSGARPIEIGEGVKTCHPNVNHDGILHTPVGVAHEIMSLGKDLGIAKIIELVMKSLQSVNEDSMFIDEIDLWPKVDDDFVPPPDHEFAPIFSPRNRQTSVAQQ